MTVAPGTFASAAALAFDAASPVSSVSPGPGGSLAGAGVAAAPELKPGGGGLVDAASGVAAAPALQPGVEVLFDAAVAMAAAPTAAPAAMASEIIQARDLVVNMWCPSCRGASVRGLRSGSTAGLRGSVQRPGSLVGVRRHREPQAQDRSAGGPACGLHPSA